MDELTGALIGLARAAVGKTLSIAADEVIVQKNGRRGEGEAKHHADQHT